jgi:acyl transferase domain-containing protein/NAD(P)H-dependent flavin oxidoreductase YrpB (nitropropane dioxygenase family)/NAD(P)-dependent dehydrogenase (short-subunit alcohol dehydrogenase family)
MGTFQIITASPPGFPHPDIAIAGCRAGGVGVLDVEYCPDTPAVLVSIASLSRSGGSAFGLKVNGHDYALLEKIASRPAKHCQLVIVGHLDPEELPRLLKTLGGSGLEVWLECTSLAEARKGEAAGVAGVIAKGHEAGGRVGQETTFILLQQFVRNLSIPVWAQGGIGLHTASACYGAGAAGVVLDSQLTLTRESPLPEAVRARIARFDGSETLCLGEVVGESYRCCARLGTPLIKELEELDRELGWEGAAPKAAQEKWRRAVATHVGWQSPDQHLFLFGQDIGFAGPLAHKFKTIGGIVEGIRQAIRDNCQAAAVHRPLSAAAPLAQSHGTWYPLVQGPMARVSDNPEFIGMVAQEGALSFIAAAWMRAPELEETLQKTATSLQDRPWGVGLLGFLPQDLYLEQQEVILRHRPRFALIAGGKAHQVKQLEQEGVATYVHVPSPGLLRMFLEEGLTKFVFEGRESGGHVGPFCSFVLFEAAINVLLESPVINRAPENYHILFAGGIHDALSASLVGVMAGQLAAKGVKVGLQLGTAYLFTQEAVKSGAIVRAYQEAMLHCRGTTLLTSSPGQAERVIETPFVQIFQQQKWLKSETGATPEEVRNHLDRLKLGRLRIATKGLARNPDYRGDPCVPKFIHLSEEEQRQQGIYLVGQLAVMRDAVATTAALHDDLTAGATARLETIWQACREDFAEAAEALPADIAIVGMACLFPGASSLQGFWENILNRVNAIREVPPERWDWRLYYDQDRDAKDKVCSRWGAFLDDIPFDPAAYGMPPNSLHSIEPLQLLTLEVAKRALEDAGYATRPFRRERTAVVFGISGSGELAQAYSLRTALPTFFGDQSRDMMTHFEGVLPSWTEDTFPGILMNVAAGRIANRLNLGGTNCTVDAACASSLAAAYWAVQELESRACDMALVGGADCMQNPFTYMCFAKTQALSPRGTCKSLDESADGIVLGEGVAVMVLKRLADAERAGDRIYAVIKGVGAASDGRDKSLTAPNQAGQVRALHRAFARACVSPATVGLVEAHATGTAVGDRIEIESLHQVFREAGAKPQGCAIGSIKSMIGHTKSTAGLASLIKAALALQHKVLPPTLGVEQPNAALVRPDTPFSVNNEMRPWPNPPENQPRRAGVSAFGFGGTNFHVVLEEYAGNYLDQPCPSPFQDWPAELFFWERGSRQELLETIRSFAAGLKDLDDPSMGNLAFTRHKDQQKERGRAGTGVRLAVVASGVDDLREKLARSEAALADARKTFSDAGGFYFSEQPREAAGKVAFLFPGQGSQYVNMIADLTVQFPGVRAWFERGDQLLADRLPRPMTSYVFPPSAFTEEEQSARKEALADTRIAQPALGAADLALFHLLQALGIHPEMVAGHSYGEYVALSAAGVLAADDLIRLSEARASFIASGAGPDPGGMAAINADVDTVADLIEKVQGVWVANVNAPQQTVISGSQPGIAAAVEIVRRQGLQARPIPVSAAFHSPLVSGAGKALGEYLGFLELNRPQLTIFSNTTAGPYPEEPGAIARLLVEHLGSRVEFVREVTAMYEAGARVFVEVGPGQVLTGLVSQILGERPHLAVATNQAGRSGLVSLLQALAPLMVQGVPVNLEKVFQGRALRRLEAGTEGQDRKYTASTWMVNGGEARPLDDYAGSLPGKRATPYLLGEAPLTGPPESVSGPDPAGPPLGNPGDQVMVQYQRLMQRFLETQKAVMLHYLEAAGQSGGAVEQPETCRSERPGTERAADAVDIAAPAEPVLPPRADRVALAASLLKIVSDRTGYPADTLGLNLDLEADLSIDSIKRTEIIGHFLQTLFPVEEGGPPEELLELSRVNTLGGIIELAAGCSIPAASKSAAIQTPTEPAVCPAPAPSQEILPRFILSASPATAPARALRLAPGRVAVITDDGRGIASALAANLRQRGVNAVLVQVEGEPPAAAGGYHLPDLSPASLARLVETIRREQGPLGGLVHLLPLGGGTSYDELDLEGWRARLHTDIVLLYQLLQLAGSDLNQAAAAGGAWVVSASGLGGLFVSDTQATADFFPGQGGIAGLLKTAALEFPEVKVACVDLNLSEAPVALVDHLLAEIEAQDGLVEVGYHRGQRLTLIPEETPLLSRPLQELNLDSSSVILVTGGARGITAAVSRELARRYRPTLIVAGQATRPAESEEVETAELNQPKALKAALVERRRRLGQPVNLAEVETAYRNLMKAREIRANLAALRQSGATADYVSVDVRNPAAFGEFLEQIYSRYGRLDGVVHGAGIIEDKLLRDKSLDSFDRVFGTKTESAFILSRKLQPETLKFLLLFSSVAGRFGSRGQADYTAANEVYNKLAVYLDRRWPGRVVAINWGPWKTAGMVSAEVQRQFEARGVGLIEPGAGARAFELELERGRKGEVEVVIGEGPWRQPDRAATLESDVRPLPLFQRLTTCRKVNGHLEIVRCLDPEHDLYLQDHRLDSKPVLPAAMAIEFMAEAAQWSYPEWRVAGLQRVRVYKGIVLDSGHRDMRITVDGTGELDPARETLELEVAIKEAADQGPIFYQGKVVMSRRLPLPEAFQAPLPGDLQDFGLSASEAYRRFTFHGPRFQGIRSIQGISENGMWTTIAPTSPQSCLAGEPAGQWIIDPVALDCGLQLALLWGRTYLDITPLPSSFKEIRLYQPFQAGEVLQCYYEVLREFGRQTVYANIYYFDLSGRLWGIVKEFESTGSKALNRLAGSHLREKDLPLCSEGVGFDG